MKEGRGGSPGRGWGVDLAGRGPGGRPLRAAWRTEVAAEASSSPPRRPGAPLPPQRPGRGLPALRRRPRLPGAPSGEGRSQAGPDPRPSPGPAAAEGELRGRGGQAAERDRRLLRRRLAGRGGRRRRSVGRSVGGSVS